MAKAKQQLASQIEIFDCEQRSEEWRRCRMGLVTASELSSVQAGGKGITRRKYLLTLAAELVTGEPRPEGYENEHTRRGHELEPEARKLYAMMRDAEPKLVGFVRNGNMGCSPDALLGNDGLLEIKTALSHIQIDHLLKGTFPSEHFDQCMGSLWIAEREWIDLAIYSPKLPLFVKRLHRDPNAIRNISVAVDQFQAELQDVVRKIRAMQ
jgi:hypothetical protein